MKIILLIFITSSLFSQKDPYFLTKFYFEDAVGNKKEIEIGYDTLANGCYADSTFGEEIDLSPLDSIFDVRASNYFSWRGASQCGFPPRKFIFSKRIVGCAERIISKSFCIGGCQLIFFIHAKYQPITIRWTAKDFEQINCKNKNWSFFTPDFTHNLLFNREWIYGHPKYACIKEESYTFFLGSQYVSIGERPYILMHEILGKGLDSIYGMSFNNDQTFFYCDESYNGLDQLEINSSEISVYPNPAIDRIIVRYEAGISKVQMNIYDLSGNKLEAVSYSSISEESIEINVSDFLSGIYFIECINNKGKLIHSQKIIVQ